MKKYLFISFALATLLVSIWFKDRGIFATAEEGILFHNPSLTYHVMATTWLSDGTGYINTATLPQSVTVFIFAFFSNAIGSNLAQRLFFILIITNGVFFCFKLFNELTNNRISSYIGALFYLFNVFVLSQILARSLVIGFLAWSYLPLFLYLSIKFIQFRKIKYLVYFLLSNFVFCFVYGLPTNIIVLWAPVFLYSLGLFVKTKKHKYLLRFIFLAFVWLLINIWWLYPYLTLSTEAFASALNSSKSYESLQAVSNNFPLTDIFFLRQKFFFDPTINKQLTWGNYYNNFFVVTTLFAGFLFVVQGMYKYISEKKFYWLASLLVIFTFLSKGTNPPLGELFYKFGFENFSFFSLFRNPYEKLGLLIVLPYAFYWSQGLFQTFKSKKTFYFISILLLLVVSKPYFFNEVFAKSAFITVPTEYDELDKYLSLQDKDGRLLVLPMISDHGLHYRWGFYGDEPLRYLVDYRAISRRPKIPTFSEAYVELSNIIKGDNESEISNKLDNLAIKYVIYNKDIDYENNVNIALFENIDYMKSFGNIDLYEYNEAKSIIEVSDFNGSVRYKKINNQKYIVNIEHLSSDSTLIFKETYNKRWQAVVGNKKLENHRMIYDYANAWDLKSGENIEIEITFKIYPWD